ncbi:MAG: hypothetical protein OXG39_05815 [Chloroflexi bacterium]|nr:hypothetical protein [Chloroflexota bacterium]
MNEHSHKTGAMFGVVDSLKNMSQSFESLSQHLPEDFVWPTYVKVSPFGIYVAWGCESIDGEMEESVWLTANPDGIQANANFRPDWPDCGAIAFDAQTVAEWLLELTQNWRWDASRSGSKISSSLSRKSMNKG